MRVLLLVSLLFGVLFGQGIGKPFVQVGHSDVINSLSFSPNGKILASGSQDSTIKLWEVKTERLLKTMKVGSIVHSISFSPDGKIMAAGDNDYFITLWNIEKGSVIKKFKAHSGGIRSVLFSPNGKILASGGSDGSIKLWSIKTKKLLKTLKGDKYVVKSISFSPNGKILASGGIDNTIKLWNIKTKKLLKTLKGHSSGVSTVSFSPDGKILASGSGDKSIKLWNIKTKKLMRTLKGHKYAVESLCFNDSGTRIISGSGDKTIKIWDINTGKQIRTMSGHRSIVSSVDYNSKNNILASGDLRGVIKLWNIQTGRKIKTLNNSKNIINSIAFNWIKKQLAFSYFKGEYVKLFNFKTKIFFKIKYSDASEIFFNRTGSSIALNGGVLDNTLSIYRTNKNKNFLKKIVFKNRDLVNIEFSSRKNMLFLGSNNDNIGKKNRNPFITIWDLNRSLEVKKIIIREIETVSQSGSYLNHFSLNDNEDKLVTCGIVNALWDINRGTIIKRLKFDKKYSLHKIFFTPNGKRILGCDSYYGNILIWETKTGKLERIIKAHKYKVDNIIFNNGNNTFVSHDNRKIKLWNIKTGKLINTIDMKNFIHSNMSYIDEKILLYSDSNTVNFLNVETGKLLVTLRFLENNEWIAITPEGYFNASENGAKHLNVLTSPMSVTSVDAYYETFYSPEIVKAAMEGKTIDTGLSMSDEKPAPEVEIINTPSKINKDEVEITLSIKDIGGGIGDIRLYLNGVAVKTDSRDIVRNQSKDTIQKRYTLKLLKGKNSIKVLVFNETNRVHSNDALHTITANYKIIHKPQLHALIVGIDNFKNPKLRLKYASNDAQLFADTIKSQGKGLFSKTVIHKLDSEESTTKEAIRKKFKELESLNPDDLFVFYVASHGTVDDGEYYLITSNVGSTSTRKLKLDAITQEDLKRLIANVPTTKKLIVLDTCNAGAMGNALLTRGMSEDTAMKILSRAVGSTVLSAATSQQQALEGYKEHGLFTYVLTEGLKGKADSNHDGYVKTLELANYIDDEVPELAEKLFNSAQYPVVSPSGQAFPVGKVK